MKFNLPPTELTTSATDAVLALECILILTGIWRTGSRNRWRTRLWCGVFGLIALSSFLGTVAHGFEMPDTIREAIWKPLYLSLGILIALFWVGAIYDWRGRILAARLLPCSIGVCIAFFALTEFTQGSFIVFVVYEAAVMVGVLLIYSFLAATHRLKGAAIMSLAVLLNLAAAGAQASRLSVHLVFPFDHNGIFHLVQMLGVGTLGLGIHLGMRNGG